MAAYSHSPVTAYHFVATDAAAAAVHTRLKDKLAVKTKAQVEMVKL